MPRFRSWVWLSVAGLFLGAEVLSAQAGRPSEELLPETTTGFLAVSDFDELTDRWGKTQLGQLMADPVMGPFSKDLRRQFEDRWSGVRERFGLTLDDLKGLTGGEAALAKIFQPADDHNASDGAYLVVLIDVTGHLTQANALLEKVSKNLTKKGAKRNEIKVPESNIPVIRFSNVPPPEDDPAAEPGEAFYCLSGDLLAVADDLQVVRGILGRLSAPPGQGGSLAGAPGFKAVMGRCARDNGGATPQIRWYIEPLGYVAAVRTTTPEDRRRKGKSVLEILRNQGFAAVQGIGGFWDFHVSEEFQMVQRFAIHAPRPDKYEKSMKMLVFPNGPEFTPQRWVPRDVAAYITVYIDILNAFDNLGPLFDEMFGGLEYLFFTELECQADLDKGVLPAKFREEFKELEPPISPDVVITTRDPGNTWEIKGKDETCIVRKRDKVLRVYGEMQLWEQVLEDLKTDPNGPQIDLRKELVMHLGQRVTMITSYEEVITTTSERLLFAIETTDEKAVRDAIKKTMETDADVKVRKFEDHVIWEVVEQELPEKPVVPTIIIPSLTGVDDGPLPEQGPEEADEEDARLLPHAAVTVAHGHLFVASHIDFLKEVLKPREPRDMLAANIDWQLVQRRLEPMGIEAKCALIFSRTDEEYRPTYELIRQGKMPQSETMLARVLNAIFSTGKKGEFRDQKIDGSQMPDYDVVRRYLGAAGTAISSEPNGWFVKGYTLKK